MNLDARLAKREMEVAECIAWGASYKEVPDMVQGKAGRRIALSTVRNIVARVKEKIGVEKNTEVSLWVFHKKYNVPLERPTASKVEKPSSSKIVASIFMLGIMVPATFSDHQDEFLRSLRSRTQISRTARTARPTRAGRREAKFIIES